MGTDEKDLLGRFREGGSLVVFSGAGMSAESGIATFRDAGGLWEQHDIEEVATPEAWRRDPKKVLNFYNTRRQQIMATEPNAAHFDIAALEERFEVTVITQNIDDLHERAGSKEVLHLHGEICKARSTVDPALLYPLNSPRLDWGDKCERGSQLRPHVVWFGEAVPAMEEAQALLKGADLLLVIGTSLQVYPAAGLVTWAPETLPKLVIDPGDLDLAGLANTLHWPLTASEGLRKLKQSLL